jgi:hypothetical protein
MMKPAAGHRPLACSSPEAVQTTGTVASFLGYTSWEPLTLRADYTFLIAKNDILDQELLRRPRHKASLNAAWHVTEAAVLSATLLYVGPWFDVNRAGTISGVPANGYTLVNLAGSYDLGNGLTAYARIDNLLTGTIKTRSAFCARGWVYSPECGSPSILRHRCDGTASPPAPNSIAGSTSPAPRSPGVCACSMAMTSSRRLSSFLTRFCRPIPTRFWRRRTGHGSICGTGFGRGGSVSSNPTRWTAPAAGSVTDRTPTHTLDKEKYNAPAALVIAGSGPAAPAMALIAGGSQSNV